MLEQLRMSASVRGRVQGVGFRAFVIAEACSLGLKGFVRNRPDGTVEVAAEGSTGALRGLEAALRRGPRGARVDRVATEWSAATGEFVDFDARY